MKATPSLSDIRKKLAQAIEQKEHKELDELSDKEQKKLKKLQQFLQRLRDEKNVQNRDLETWLSKEEFARFSDMWSEQKILRQQIKDKPAEVITYEAMVHKGQLYENRAEGYAAKNKSDTAQNMRHKAEREYERALEHMEETLHKDMSMCEWFDRALDLSVENAPSLTAASMPRVVTSVSLDTEGSGFLSRKLSKRDTKILAIEEAIENLLYKKPIKSESLNDSKSQSKLDELLKINDDEIL